MWGSFLKHTSQYGRTFGAQWDKKMVGDDFMVGDLEYGFNFH